MDAPRLFTQAELDALCLSPRQQMEQALSDGDPRAAKSKYGELEEAFFAFHAIYYQWIASNQEFIFERWGHEALVKAAPIGEVLVAALARRLSVGQVLNCTRYASERMGSLIDAGRRADALDLCAYMEKGIREVHDLYREWTSLLLSRVYREGAVEALEGCLRHSSEKWWMPTMMRDIALEPAQRLRNWVKLLLANFATLGVEEDDEKFTIVQAPCGSCSRQVLDGCYGPPLDLAVVREKHPITFNRGDVSVYRSHIAVMHTIMPIERIGAPWPAMVCPEGMSGGPCRVYLYKNPRTAAPEHYQMVGMKRPLPTA